MQTNQANQTNQTNPNISNQLSNLLNQNRKMISPIDWFWYIIVVIIFIIIIVFVFEYSWNYALTPTFNIKQITFFQALLIIVIFRILFPGYPSFGI